MMKSKLFLRLRYLFFHLNMVLSYWRSKSKSSRGFVGGDLNFARLMPRAKEINDKWNYRDDPLGGLYNVIDPPDYVKKYVDDFGDNDKIAFNGDCDDYASALLGEYHDYKNAYLITYFPTPITKAHTVFAARLKNQQIGVIDWGRSYTFNNLGNFVSKFQQTKNITIGKLHFAQWSPKKGRYVSVSTISSWKGDN